MVVPLLHCKAGVCKHEGTETGTAILRYNLVDADNSRVGCSATSDGTPRSPVWYGTLPCLTAVHRQLEDCGSVVLVE